LNLEFTKQLKSCKENKHFPTHRITQYIDFISDTGKITKGDMRLFEKPLITRGMRNKDIEKFVEKILYIKYRI
jgi:hypothetical protein